VSLLRRGSGASRRLLGTALLRATPTVSAGAFVVSALLVLGAVGLLVASVQVHWLPLPDGPLP
jgi:hypothetical protein